MPDEASPTISREGKWTLSSFHKTTWSTGRTQYPERCCEIIYGKFPHQCRRARGHGPELAYCKQHDPAVVQARRVSNYEKFRKRRDEQVEDAKISAAAPHMLEALRSIRDGREFPQALAATTLDALGLK